MAAGSAKPVASGRTFLVVVDDSEEMRAALRFACRRARHTGGRVALMRQEARSEAEALLKKLGGQVEKMSGETPVIYVREGDACNELLDLIDQEPGISILVLAAGVGSEGPGPLVSALTGRAVTRLHVPLTIVPGTLSDEAIDNLS
jgi:nucleotide-binding universal stress UspA family protein